MSPHDQGCLSLKPYSWEPRAAGDTRDPPWQPQDTPRLCHPPAMQELGGSQVLELMASGIPHQPSTPGRENTGQIAPPEWGGRGIQGCQQAGGTKTGTIQGPHSGRHGRRVQPQRAEPGPGLQPGSHARNDLLICVGGSQVGWLEWRLLSQLLSQLGPQTLGVSPSLWGAATAGKGFRVRRLGNRLGVEAAWPTTNQASTFPGLPSSPQQRGNLGPGPGVRPATSKPAPPKRPRVPHPHACLRQLPSLLLQALQRSPDNPLAPWPARWSRQGPRGQPPDPRGSPGGHHTSGSGS